MTASPRRPSRGSARRTTTSHARRRRRKSAGSDGGDDDRPLRFATTSGRRGRIGTALKRIGGAPARFGELASSIAAAASPPRIAGARPPRGLAKFSPRGERRSTCARSRGRVRPRRTLQRLQHRGRRGTAAPQARRAVVAASSSRRGCSSSARRAVAEHANLGRRRRRPSARCAATRSCSGFGARWRRAPENNRRSARRSRWARPTPNCGAQVALRVEADGGRSLRGTRCTSRSSAWRAAARGHVRALVAALDARADDGLATAAHPATRNSAARSHGWRRVHRRSAVGARAACIASPSVASASTSTLACAARSTPSARPLCTRRAAREAACAAIRRELPARDSSQRRAAACASTCSAPSRRPASPRRARTPASRARRRAATNADRTARRHLSPPNAPRSSAALVDHRCALAPRRQVADERDATAAPRARRHRAIYVSGADTRARATARQRRDAARGRRHLLAEADERARIEPPHGARLRARGIGNSTAAAATRVASGARAPLIAISRRARVRSSTPRVDGRRGRRRVAAMERRANALLLRRRPARVDVRRGRRGNVAVVRRHQRQRHLAAPPLAFVRRRLRHSRRRRPSASGRRRASARRRRARARARAPKRLCIVVHRRGARGVIGRAFAQGPRGGRGSAPASAPGHLPPRPVASAELGAASSTELDRRRARRRRRSRRLRRPRKYARARAAMPTVTARGVRRFDRAACAR